MLGEARQLLRHRLAATPKEAPFLEGAPVWNGYVPASPAYNPTPEDLRGPPPARAVLPLRLLQIDIGVKDARSPTGWVFGTFVYGGGPRSGPAKPDAPAQGWTNVEPVGFRWGNDPGYGRKASLKET